MCINDTRCHSPDPDIERAFDWILSFLPSGEWKRRRLAIEKYLESLFHPKPTGASITGFNRLIGTEDRIGWYLYLVETSQHEPHRTEVNQASRVLPVFKRLGMELDRLMQIGGIESQVSRLLGTSKDQPDSVLFEILVALLWSRNGWRDVSFILPSRKRKRPDIRAANGGDEWFIETKRMATNSGYTQKERDKWLRMWLRLKDCLIRERYPLILDIAFHVELEQLNDSFPYDELAGKLKFVTGPCHLISNEIWDVSAKFVDLAEISKHLDEYYVKCHSRQLQELIGGSWDRKKGFTFVMLSSNVRIGGERGINQYVEHIDWAAGVYWHCDSDRAQEAKARDVRRHLADAIEQLPANGRGVVHVGIETLDGEVVEAERYARIVNTVASFDAKGKDLRWVYTHLFESYAPPQKAWSFDETIYKFGANQAFNPEPISEHNTVAAGDDELSGGVHWLREAP
jgi:hypothetical protein